MSNLERYINKRKKSDKEFEKNFDTGYQEFKIGEIFKQARLEKGLTQEDIANRLNTKKQAISRIENYVQDIRLSTLQNFAQILGKKLKVELI